MRLSISLLALLAAAPAVAEDFIVRADIAEAVVYANLAEVVRQETVDMPAGTHRILFPMTVLDHTPVVRTSSGVLGEIEAISRYRVDEGALDSAAQAAARSAVDDALDAVDEARAQLEAAAGRIRAAELQQAYLQSIVRGGDEGVAMPDDAAALAAILATLGSEMANASTALHEARQAQMALQEEFAERQEALAVAEERLAQLQPWAETLDMWAVTLDVATADTVTIEIDDLDQRAGWQPFYDVHLDSETGGVRVERSVGLYTSQGWEDVRVTLSTADPQRQRDPSQTVPSRASIFEPRPDTRTGGGGLMAMDMLSESEIAAAPVIEPVVIVEDTAALLQIEGLSMFYPYPGEVSIGAGSDVFLPFGEIELEADLINRAVPRRDSTAFLVAEVENLSDEPILPGQARFFRDGSLIGEDYLDYIPTGAVDELNFGPLDHLQLTWTDLSRNSGDRGVFVSSNIEDRRVMVTAENLSGEPVDVQLLYATPFSEQEDLEIEVGSSLAPDETAWNDLRGVYAWDFTLDPGAETEISMQFEFDWPDGMVLNWQP